MLYRCRLGIADIDTTFNCKLVRSSKITFSKRSKEDPELVVLWPTAWHPVECTLPNGSAEAFFEIRLPLNLFNVVSPSPCAIPPPFEHKAFYLVLLPNAYFIKQIETSTELPKNVSSPSADPDSSRSHGHPKRSPS